jgi:hypothetical protein
MVTPGRLLPRLNGRTAFLFLVVAASVLALPFKDGGFDAAFTAAYRRGAAPATVPADTAGPARPTTGAVP